MRSRLSCRYESFRISISAASRYLPVPFSCDFCVHLLLVVLGRFEVPRHERLRFPQDSYSTEYIMQNWLRWNDSAKERKRMLPIRDVYAYRVDVA